MRGVRRDVRSTSNHRSTCKASSAIVAALPAAEVRVSKDERLRELLLSSHNEKSRRLDCYRKIGRGAPMFVTAAKHTDLVGRMLLNQRAVCLLPWTPNRHHSR
jgi:hypothetical protein